MQVERVTSATSELEAAMARLVPQLTTTSPPPTSAELALLVADAAVTLLAARHDGRIVGVALVVVFRKPTGLACRLEDVVVDAAARGQGTGAALVTAALELARERGARTMELTSGPFREAANRLYARLGFHWHGTNVYRMEL